MWGGLGPIDNSIGRLSWTRADASEGVQKVVDGPLYRPVADNDEAFKELPRPKIEMEHA